MSEEELYEIEVAEDDIYAYIVDENDNEIGFILLNEKGEEEEYLYADIEEEADRPSKSGISRDDVSVATANVNAVYKEGAQIASELKNTFGDISSCFDFLK